MTYRIRRFCALPFLLMFLIAPRAVVDARQVSGDVSGRWSIWDSPVVMLENARVAPGDFLTIEPGVQVLMGPGVTFAVDGSLTAVGTTDQPIRFDPSNTTAPWKAIAVGATGQAYLMRCEARGGGAAGPTDINGAIRVDGGVLELLYCNIIGSASSGALVNGGLFRSTASHFDRNGGALPIDAGIHVVTGNVTLTEDPAGNAITNSIFGLYNHELRPVVARGVWWGSSGGPQHATNLPGHGVSVSDDVDFQGFATVNPFVTPGDVDRDGHVTLRDVAELLKVAGGLIESTPFHVEVGDANADGLIDLMDVQSFVRGALDPDLFNPVLLPPAG